MPRSSRVAPSRIVWVSSLLVALAACRPSASAPDAAETRATSSSASPPARRTGVGTDPGHVGQGTPLVAREGHELAAFAGGCFWGVEDVFRQVPGVVATAVGYTGGRTAKPTYESVCSHTTGHAETVLLEFDPSKVTYEELLDVFFANHDPTTKNRQGPDVGDQYRSAVFTFSDAQATKAKAAITKAQPQFTKPIVTEITPAPAFWKAEEYHQQYDEKTGTHSCPIPRRLPKGA